MKTHASSNSRHVYFLVLLLLAVGCASGQLLAKEGKVLFFDDFHSYDPGPKPKGDMGLWENFNASAPGHEIEIQNDENKLFGQGISNQYVRFHDGGDVRGLALAMRAINAFEGKKVITASCSIIMPEGSRPLNMYVGIDKPSGPTTAMVASIDTETIPDRKQAVRLDIVFNNSNAVLRNYQGDGIDLEPKHFDIWRDGERIAAGESSPGALPVETPLTSVTLQTSTGTGRNQESLVDWVAIFEGAVVGLDPKEKAASGR